MKRDAIWLISGGPMQAVAAQRIRDRGLALVLSDGSAEAHCRPQADCFLHLDTFDLSGHLQAAERVRERYNILAVVTVGADCHVTVCHLARHLGLHHLEPEVAEACRHKGSTRALLSQAGLLQPRFTLVRSHAEAQAWLAGAQVDHVLKATDNSGSRGFSVVPAGQAPSTAQFESARAMGTTGEVVIEERLRPHPQQVSEASVETLWQDGRMHWINGVDRIFASDLRFYPQLQLNPPPKDGVEIGHVNPWRRPNALRDQVAQDIERAGQALGMAHQRGAHLLKADIFFSDRGPVILELTPRCSGGWDSSGSSLARGAQIADGVIHMALGRPVDLAAWFQFFEFRYPQVTVAVVTRIPEGADDCIGRQFALQAGLESTDALLQGAHGKIHRGEFHVPVL